MRLTSARVWIAALTLIISAVAAMAAWLHFFRAESGPAPGNRSAVLQPPSPDAAQPPHESGS